MKEGQADSRIRSIITSWTKERKEENEKKKTKKEEKTIGFSGK